MVSTSAIFTRPSGISNLPKTIGSSKVPANVKLPWISPSPNSIILLKAGNIANRALEKSKSISICALGLRRRIFSRNKSRGISPEALIP